MTASGDDQPTAVAGDGDATTTAIGPEDAGTARAPAADLFTAIEQEHPGDRDAAALLTTAGHNLDAAKAPAAQPAIPPAQPRPGSGPQKNTTEGVELGARRDLAEHAEREPVPQGATTEGTQGAHPGMDRGAAHVTQHEREPSPTRQRWRLVPIPVVTGVLAVIGAVMLAVSLSGCRGPSGGQGPGPTTGPTYRVTATVPVGKSAFGVAVDPGTHTVYVTNGLDTVSVIDASTRTVTATVPVGNGTGPLSVAVDPGTHTVYVTNTNRGNSNRVLVIDGAMRTVTATVPVGKGPAAVAVDPGTHTVYVANYEDDTVSVIEHR
jgi:YVTN family beta-propeller protein